MNTLFNVALFISIVATSAIVSAFTDDYANRSNTYLRAGSRRVEPSCESIRKFLYLQFLPATWRARE